MGDPNLPKPDSEPQVASSKESFLGIPLKGWAIFAISLIAVCAALAHYSIRVYGDWQEQKRKVDQATSDKVKVTEERDKLESVNQITSKTTNLITQEIAKHRNDHSGHQVHLDSAGKILATYFESDECISIARPGQTLPYLDHPGDRVEWSLGPSVTPPAQSSIPVSSSTSGRPDTSTLASKGQEDATPLGRSKRPRLLKVQAGCLNPHPWQFQSWWGPANGCIAPLYRKWNDGCIHHQFYNACTGQWDPRIFWTNCNPNHYP